MPCVRVIRWPDMTPLRLRLRTPAQAAAYEVHVHVSCVRVAPVCCEVCDRVCAGCGAWAVGRRTSELGSNPRDLDAAEIAVISTAYGIPYITVLHTGHAELERGTRRPPTAGRGPEGPVSHRTAGGSRDTREVNKSAPPSARRFSPRHPSEFRFPEPGAERYFRVSLSRSDGLQRPKVPLPQSNVSLVL